MHTDHLKEEMASLGEDDLGRRDLWMFAPLLGVVAALPLATVAVLGASLWFVSHSSDRYAETNFANRWQQVYTR